MEKNVENVKAAQEKFGELIQSEFERIERMKADNEVTDFDKLKKIVIGVLPGDGIGPIIMKQALRVLNDLLAPEIASGRIEIREIEGMTIENRAAKLQILPDDVFEEIKKCNVLIKGPMVTPRAGEPWPNLVSANSLLRRGLELFAAVRPIKIPDKNIDWTFFRENIEGEYIWGNKGIQVNDDLAVDFKVQTKQGSERIARAAFEFARKNGKKNVTIVTKANIVKLADGNFIKAVRKVGEEYPEIEIQERLVDAMCAKMLDPEFNKGIQVNDDLAVDFKVQTKQGSERIARAAFEFARKNGKKNVTIVTKANIVKLADGNFIKAVRKVGEEYPEIEIQERLVDAMCAKMLDPEFNKGIEVVVLPNLYGDIVTDVAAEHQGGLGTASSSNLGNKYAMFEAIHGTAPFLINHGRGDYADPCSLIRAAGMLMAHIGYADRKAVLDKALDICTITERKKVVTTDVDGASAAEFTDYLLETIDKIK